MSTPPPTWRDWPPSSGPRKVEGGIKARSKRGAIGERWWSRRFIEVLESFGMQGRLARGRNYARSGQVMSLDISAGYVTANVQGSRPKPYRVRLQVLPLTTRQWQRVEQALAGRALFRARLLAGEMPAEIEDVFGDCGTPLFPRSARELEMTCSCPDWGLPCKHMAAVCYVLAEAFDDDPFAMLAWRGKTRADLLAALRGLGGGGTEPAGSRSVRGGPGGSSPQGSSDGAGPLAGLADRPLAESLDSFWTPGLSQARLRMLPPAPAAPADLLLRSFEPPPVQIRGEDLVTVLAPAYRLMTGQRADEVKDEPLQPSR